MAGRIRPSSFKIGLKPHSKMCAICSFQNKRGHAITLADPCGQPEQRGPSVSVLMEGAARGADDRRAAAPPGQCQERIAPRRITVYTATLGTVYAVGVLW